MLRQAAVDGLEPGDRTRAGGRTCSGEQDNDDEHTGESCRRFFVIPLDLVSFAVYFVDFACEPNYGNHSVGNWQ
jgi:hypothetical protein